MASLHGRVGIITDCSTCPALNRVIARDDDLQNYHKTGNTSDILIKEHNGDTLVIHVLGRFDIIISTMYVDRSSQAADAGPSTVYECRLTSVDRRRRQSSSVDSRQASIFIHQSATPPFTPRLPLTHKSFPLPGLPPD